MQIRFTKMHGAMNDYIYVDCFAQRLDGVDLPRLAREISDRHRGVGSDGLILIAPPTPGAAADVRMEMYNSDGSRGEMCGNGIRCVAKYALEHQLLRSGAAAAKGNYAARVTLAIETDRGTLPVFAERGADGRVHRVLVGMGAPILETASIPVRVSGARCVRQPIVIDGRTLETTCVSMGNPHAVFFVESEAALGELALAKIGPRIERHEWFPNRTNVHFVFVRSNREAVMRTWERGAGATMACGTGACAALVAAVLEGRMQRQATLHVPGGALECAWPEGGEVTMAGEAVEIFSGEWDVLRQA